jgi:chromosome segregation ATPase
MSKKGRFSLFPIKESVSDALAVQEECQKRAEELGQKITLLNEKVDYYDSEIGRLKKEARDNAKTNKRRAINAVKRIKTIEKQQEQTWTIAQNMQSSLDQIQEAVMNIAAIVSIQTDTKLIEKILAANGLDQDKIDQIQDDAAEMRAKMEEISRVVAAPIGGDQFDEGELEDELAALLADDQPEAVPGRVAPAADLDPDVNDLLAAFA